MKNLAESLFDKKGILDRDVYKHHPTTRKELNDCIEKELDLQGPDANLNIIDVSEITDMNWLFDDFRYIRNIDISMWDVSKVKDMFCMFTGCKNFNCDLSQWNVSNVENMNGMFWGCKKFNCDLSAWDVSNVKYMEGMFIECKSLKKIPYWYKA